MKGRTDRGEEIAGIAWRVMWGVWGNEWSVDAARLEGWGFWIMAGVLNGDGDYISMLAY